MTEMTGKEKGMDCRTDKTSNSKYEDIIQLPHHVSATRPQMDRLDRAAQFSPFAALTGYEEAVEETARLTEALVEAEGRVNI